MINESPCVVQINDRIKIAFEEPVEIAPKRNHRFIRFGKYARLISGPIAGSPTTNTHSLLVIGDTNNSVPEPTSTTPRVDPCSPGDITLFVDRSLTTNRWYFLYDANKKETHRQSSEERTIGGELVYVTTYTNGEIELRNPLTQSYGGTGSDIVLVDVSDRVCENISIRGGTFLGKRQTGMRAQIDCGMVAA